MVLGQGGRSGSSDLCADLVIPSVISISTSCQRMNVTVLGNCLHPTNLRKLDLEKEHQSFCRWRCTLSLGSPELVAITEAQVHGKPWRKEDSIVREANE